MVERSRDVSVNVPHPGADRGAVGDKLDWRKPMRRDERHLVGDSCHVGANDDDVEVGRTESANLSVESRRQKCVGVGKGAAVGFDRAGITEKREEADLEPVAIEPKRREGDVGLSLLAKVSIEKADSSLSGDGALDGKTGVYGSALATQEMLNYRGPKGCQFAGVAVCEVQGNEIGFRDEGVSRRVRG
jgi:hypothetical protein